MPLLATEKKVLTLKITYSLFNLTTTTFNCSLATYYMPMAHKSIIVIFGSSLIFLIWMH